MGSQAGSFRKASPETPNINEQEKRIKRLEKLKRDLQNIKNERDELQGILANYCNKNLNDRINFETFMLTMQHDQVMTDLKRMTQEISEALSKYKELTTENQLYYFRTCHLLTECNHIKQKVRMLRKENRQLFAEQKALEECNILRKILCKEDSQKNKNKYSRQSAGKQIIVVPGSREKAAVSNPCA
ncbi:uncharacterized protein LOC545047 [Mus musculus]|uniref:Predicted gene 5800 n=1 Tax=Mus musculus TaxID=10090 RepID=Q497L3_MOUSE|nr:uncharacterized protein LOC545047 [Mus musculus]AAI00480.1 Predicted gene, EG545047 [Mus musculus]|eukprot:NP_001029274.1 uncharacterized protein LOC545047 [Mus musculus]